MVAQFIGSTGRLIHQADVGLGDAVEVLYGHAHLGHAGALFTRAGGDFTQQLTHVVGAAFDVAHGAGGLLHHICTVAHMLVAVGDQLADLTGGLCDVLRERARITLLEGSTTPLIEDNV